VQEDRSKTPTPLSSPDKLNDSTPALSAPEADVYPVAEPDTVQEQPVPMLDVHSLHETTRTWKDFFIHIAIITIGLLIAIGLEQTVEYLHHRHQAAEMAENLVQESIENREVVQYDLARIDESSRVLRENVTKLLSIRASALPKPFVPTRLSPVGIYSPADTAWVTIRDSALLPIVSQLLVKNYWKLEYIIQRLSLYTGAAAESRVRLSSLLNIHGESDVLTRREVDDLLLGFSDYREHLEQVRGLVMVFRTENNLAIDNKVITIKSSIAAQAADRDSPQAPSAEQVHRETASGNNIHSRRGHA
jgi:hypothetical protein